MEVIMTDWSQIKRKLVSYDVIDGKICNQITYCNSIALPTKCINCNSQLTKPYIGTSKKGTKYQSSHCQSCKKFYTLHYNKVYPRRYHESSDVHGVDVETFYEYYGSDPHLGFFDLW